MKQTENIEEEIEDIIEDVEDISELSSDETLDEESEVKDEEEEEDSEEEEMEESSEEEEESVKEDTAADAYLKERRAKLAEGAHKDEEIELPESEINSDAEFKEYARTVLQKAHGDKYDESVADKTAEDILAKVEGDYGAAVGMLTSGLGEEVELEEAVSWDLIQSMYVKDAIDILVGLTLTAGVAAYAVAKYSIATYISRKKKDKAAADEAAVLKKAMDKISKDKVASELVSQIKEFPFDSKKDNSERKRLIKQYRVRLKSLLTSDEYNQLNDIYNKTIREDIDLGEEEIEEEIDVDASRIDALVESEENLSEGFKQKASIIFETAVREKVASAKSLLEERYENLLSEETTRIKERIEDQIDGYLTAMVENWAEENKVAIENSLRTEIAENFIKSLKSVFVEHYVDVPEGKKDLYESIEAENA
jgi:hypothetical protein